MIKICRFIVWCHKGMQHLKVRWWHAQSSLEATLLSSFKHTEKANFEHSSKLVNAGAKCRRRGCWRWMNTFSWYDIIKEVCPNVRKRNAISSRTKNRPFNPTQQQSIAEAESCHVGGFQHGFHPTCRPVHWLRHSSDPAELPCHSCFAACLANFYGRHMWRLSAPRQQQGKNRRRPTGMAAQLCKSTTVEKKPKKQQLSHNPGQGPVTEGLSNAFLAEKDRSCS